MNIEMNGDEKLHRMDIVSPDLASLLMLETLTQIVQECAMNTYVRLDLAQHY